MKNLLLSESRSPRNEQSKSLGLFLITLLIGASLVGYLTVKKIQLNGELKVIQNCVRKEYCQGRIEALERLIKAKRSLKFHNLSSANLSNANLRSANLSTADLRSANLSNINLSSGNLISADFSTANLSRANLSKTNLSSADLISANLSNINLSRANLSKTNLSSADLISANLSHANLSSAYLISSNLSSADLSHSDFSNAHFFNTNLSSANLIDTDLSHTQNLTLSQIKTACNWEEAFYKSNWDHEKREWIVNEKANKQYIEKLKKDTDSEPKEPVDCSKWE